MASSTIKKDVTTNPTLVSSDIITDDATFGSIEFRLYSNGIKTIAISNTSFQSATYIADVIPVKYRPLTAYVVGVGSTTANVTMRRVLLVSDGRIGVAGASEDGLFTAFSYV